jgi:hypothetical protein
MTMPNSPITATVMQIREIQALMGVIQRSMGFSRID